MTERKLFDEYVEKRIGPWSSDWLFKLADEA